MLLMSRVWACAISLAFYKRNEKLHPHALSSYKSTWEFLRTLEKCEKHSASPCASLCTSLVFLKIPACLYNSTMHSDAFFISLINIFLVNYLMYIIIINDKVQYLHLWPFYLVFLSDKVQPVMSDKRQPCNLGNTYTCWK